MMWRSDRSRDLISLALVAHRIRAVRRAALSFAFVRAGRGAAGRGAALSFALVRAGVGAALSFAFTLVTHALALVIHALVIHALAFALAFTFALTAFTLALVSLKRIKLAKIYETDEHRRARRAYCFFRRRRKQDLRPQTEEERMLELLSFHRKAGIAREGCSHQAPGINLPHQSRG